ncbi:MAG: hypothetical protein ABSH01_20345 [Terriglobia bacterium]
MSEHLPVHLESPNAIGPAQTFTAFLISVVAPPCGMLPPCGTHALLGMKRFSTDGTIRNLFKRFTPGMVVRFYEPLWAWVAAAPRGWRSEREATVWTWTRRYWSARGSRKG